MFIHLYDERCFGFLQFSSKKKIKHLHQNEMLPTSKSVLAPERETTAICGALPAEGERRSGVQPEPHTRRDEVRSNTRCCAAATCGVSAGTVCVASAKSDSSGRDAGSGSGSVWISASCSTGCDGASFSTRTALCLGATYAGVTSVAAWLSADTVSDTTLGCTGCFSARTGPSFGSATSPNRMCRPKVKSSSTLAATLE